MAKDDFRTKAHSWVGVMADCQEQIEVGGKRIIKPVVPYGVERYIWLYRCRLVRFDNEFR